MTGAHARSNGRLALWYAAAFSMLAVWSLLRCPILPADTDLWFHLDAGRDLFRQRALPQDTSSFSFLSPPRPWVDYAWAFQALVYAVHALSGYLGLVLFRAAAFGATLWLIFGYLRRGPSASSSSGWMAAVFTLATLVLLPRDLLIRPHLLSYAFMALVLFALEYRPRWLVMLPLVAVAWCNAHGIMYPFLWLMTGAYAAEALIARMRREPDPVGGLLLAAGLASAAVFATPHGAALLPLPFHPLGEVSQFIGELQPVGLLSPVGLNLPTVFRAYVLLAGAAAVASLVRRRARSSHLVLFAAGVLLLAKGNRFMAECVLLSLPVLAANPLSVRLPGRRWAAPVGALAVGILLLLPVHLLSGLFRTMPRFPVAGETLPEGIVAFLNRADLGGRVLHPVDAGGYLRWALSPRYSIFMDMQVPHPFTEDDFRLGRNVFQSPQLFAWVVSRYDPTAVIAPIGLASFKNTIGTFPDFVPVFFDDTAVLYLNRRHHPELASRAALTDVDPYQLVSQEADRILSAYEHERLMQRLAAVLLVHPRCGIAHYLAAKVYETDRAYDRMIPHAQAMMRDFPASPGGYQVMEDALRGLQAAEEAMRYRRLAMARAR